MQRVVAVSQTKPVEHEAESVHVSRQRPASQRNGAQSLTLPSGLFTAWSLSQVAAITHLRATRSQALPSTQSASTSHCEAGAERDAIGELDARERVIDAAQLFEACLGRDADVARDARRALKALRSELGSVPAAPAARRCGAAPRRRAPDRQPGLRRARRHMRRPSRMPRRVASSARAYTVTNAPRRAS